MNARNFAEFGLNPFIHERAFDIEALPEKRDMLQHFYYVSKRMGKTAGFVVEQTFKTIGLGHLDF